MNKKDRLQARRLPVGRIRKRAMYKAIHERYQREMRLLRSESKNRRESIRKDIPSVSWLPWLQKQAMSGREDAIKALRSRDYALAKKRNADIGGDGAESPRSLVNIPGAKVDAITKQGIVIYNVGADAIRDDGHTFRISRNATADTDAMALKMAMQRYGRKLHIHGDMEFKERMVDAAVKNRLYVGFVDPEMESRRRMMMIATPKKSKATTQERI